MKTFVTASFAIAGLLAATPAGAIPRTWVSSTGGGSACTRAAPCATFQAAHDATDPNGELNGVGSGDFGPDDPTSPARVVITKSITIDCTGTLAAISAGNGVVVIAAGAVVRLRNLTITGQGSGAGIFFNSGGAARLFIENCTITNF